MCGDYAVGSFALGATLGAVTIAAAPQSPTFAQNGKIRLRNNRNRRGEKKKKGNMKRNISACIYCSRKSLFAYLRQFVRSHTYADRPNEWSELRKGHERLMPFCCAEMRIFVVENVASIGRFIAFGFDFHGDGEMDSGECVRGARQLPAPIVWSIN